MSGLRQIATEPANLDSKAMESKSERSPKLRHHTKSHSERISDSELSTETNSLSAESNNDNGRSPVKSTPSGLDLHQPAKTKHRRRGAEWEIIDSFKSLQTVDQVPTKLEGFLSKKRKWPLKGWHKVTAFIHSLFYRRIVSGEPINNCVFILKHICFCLASFFVYRGISSWRKAV